ncbi:elongator complex protein 1 isoform X2 [Tripterygium wilfordii]|uniref:elongator complex protein 1 isoform X2 n=1 Tax=Tripterygium wilfordii TaxID=458696 RepID=UPI0018F84356|nr:elongator complex protein 1 isoform X2 [Tripterygium wilfordii]
MESTQNARSWSNTLLHAEVDPIDLVSEDFITSFDYLMEKEALLIGTSNGLLLLHSVDDNSTEVVGRVEGSVKSISPSPDGDMLGIVTGFGQVLVMTHDWDLLYEIGLEDFPDGVDVREQENMFDSSISWRGDGKYFSTLSGLCNPPSLHKRLKIWERESGALHATSDSKEFMGTLLDWMPSGAKIAAICDRKAENGCPSIAFFERNGLERSAFNINEQLNATVELLKWNGSSDLLAAVVRGKEYDSVKIWFFSNNHWYLKHEIRYLRQDGVRFMWDPTKPLQLICWTLGGQITIYNFMWTTAVIGNSTALVIDDSKILVTPLSLSLMPPPLYLFSLKFPSAVRDVALYSKNSKNCVAACLSNGSLCVVEFPAPHTWEDLEGKEYTVEASICDAAFGSFVHLTWLDSHILLAVSHCGFSHSNSVSLTSSRGDGIRGYYLQEIDLVCSEDHVPGLITSSGWHARISCRNSLEEMVIGISSNPAKRCSSFVQFYDGKICEYTSKLGLANSGGASKHDAINFTSLCSWMSAVLVQDNGFSRPLLFGLDEIGRLHVSGKILCNNCSSFSFYSIFDDEVITHLILVTKQDFLVVVEITDILHGDIDSKYGNFIHVHSRRREEENIHFISLWEKGAKILGVLHGDEAAVVIQTTRGNLECIYPRKLVLASIINALNQRRFRDALLLVRRHRIDFNIIVDYCGWQAFIQSAPEFVRQLDSLTYVTEFVSGIKNENIILTLYSNYISLPCQKNAEKMGSRDFNCSDASNKISSVLLAIRKALEEHVLESPARELCILTTLARSDPPALEEALNRIKEIRDMELVGPDKPRRISHPSAEEALKHLLWLSNPDAVYEAALGLYDLNLAAIVALNSQWDPKEFLPFLQELEEMPGELMRYKIDLRLCRFDRALRNIVSAGDAYYADCMNLIKKNPQLFPLGLQLLTDPVKRTQILEAWGDNLSDEKCFEDAATTYLCCSCLEKALKAYRACGNWSQVLTVAGLLKLGKDEIMQLAHELCEELQALGKPGEAAKIALEYCGDVNRGISLLISARDWEEALRVALLHRREELISEVKIASLECASLLIGESEEGLEKVGKYLARYLAVRQRRLLLAAKLQDEERSLNDLDDDTASETSSNFSGMSAYTTGTRKGSAASITSTIISKGKNTRQRQKKRGKIRPGSPDEEMALIEHLKAMSFTVGAKRELRSLLVSLVMLCEDATARKLQHAVENYQLSQMAAVKLTEDASSTEVINEHAHTLQNYIPKVRHEMQSSEDFFWRSMVFISP